ncbi:MAG: putative DNA binding domain-containing protein [Spirochaetales bacterium]|nr:putative DNA binding domain-containing protein [Spirochaetales bacterium]
MKENQNIEWKENWRDEYIKWICGFANAQGGILYIGKDDSGKIVGIKNGKKLLEDIPNKVRDLLGIIVHVNLHHKNGFDFLEIVVESYPHPVSYKGHYHIRTGSTKQELKGAALDRFLLKKQGKTWDGVPVPYVNAEDLSDSAINLFRDLARKSRRLDSKSLEVSNKELLKKLHLFDGDYLKRSGVLLFHPDPEQFVTGAYVKIGFFRTDSDLLYHDEIHGDLFTQASKTMDVLLTKYLKAGISYEGIHRVETLPVPENALREAILNALVHRDYSTGAPIQISVYADKLMIWNSCVLPQNWTIEDLRGKHSSQPYNPDMANTFFRAGEIEAWGRGIENIFTECRMANCPAPELRLEGAFGLWVEFPFQTQKSSGKSSEKIIQLLEQDEKMTIPELAEILELSTRAVEKHIKKFQDDGLLKRIGSRKSGHWEVSK